MANLVLAFAELLGGAIILDAAIKGDTIAHVVTGQATQQALPGASGGGTTPAGSSSPSGSLPAGTYTNPVPGASTGRIDQGVDYTLSGKGFLAPGRAKILIANQSDPGWAGGGYIAYQLLDGPLAGAIGFVAEGIAPVVQAGQTVAAGTMIARPAASPYNGIVGNIEAGWADPNSPGRPLAQALSGYGGDQSTQALTAGYSFSQFVHALGGVAGVFQGAGSALASAIAGAFSHGHPAAVPYG